jgi:hypothetical protein
MQLDYMNKWRELDILPFVPTLSVGWDPKPWHNPSVPWLSDDMKRWYLQPAEYEDLCRRVKALMESLPDQSLGRRMAMLDNWNEWGEGHFIAPHQGHGFGYLDAVRNVFTTASREHKDLVPGDVGLGPYDSLFRGKDQK